MFVPLVMKRGAPEPEIPPLPAPKLMQIRMLAFAVPPEQFAEKVPVVEKVVPRVTSTVPKATVVIVKVHDNAACAGRVQKHDPRISTRAKIVVTPRGRFIGTPREK